MSTMTTPAGLGTDVSAAQPSIQTLNIRKEILTEAPIDIAWECLLEEMGPESEMPDGTKFPRVLEAFPGGRWYRDTGKDTGHLWGHVQVIKPPALLEICGPLFMSYPVASHLQYRLTTEGKATRLTLHHQAIGLIDPKHAEGVNKGWDFMTHHIRRIAEAKAGK